MSFERTGPDQFRGLAIDEGLTAGAVKVQAIEIRSLVQVASSQRFRLQVACVVTLVAIVAFAAILPFHTLRILADGKVVRVTTHTADRVSAARQAGIELGPGDVVEASGENALIVRRAARVLLRVDGETYTLRTQAETVAGALNEAGATLGPRDSLLRGGAFVPLLAPIVPPGRDTSRSHDDDTAFVAAAEIEVRRAVPFSVIESGRKLELHSSRQTVGEALRDAGVRVGPGDQVQPSADTELASGLRVHIEHATEIPMMSPEGKVILYALADTVSEALTEGGIRLLAGHDLGSTGEIPISAGLSIHIVSVVVAGTGTLGAIVYESDSSRLLREGQVVAGRHSLLNRRYLVVRQDGEALSRELVAEWYDAPPSGKFVSATSEVASSVSSKAAAGQDWTQLVCSCDWNCEWALSVMRCESGGDPDAYNSRGPFVGLFQVWEGYGGDLRDPAINVASAYSLYLSGGSGHWPDCP